MRHIVMYSGGVGSWAAAKRVAAVHGTASMVLLFCDTRTEDEDTYRFLEESARNIGLPITVLCEGRTIWEVFRDERYLGNTRADPCSRILKRELADRWLKENCASEQTMVYVGIDWSEIHRLERLQRIRAPWQYQGPLCEPPYLTKNDLHCWASQEGLEKQRLYALGAAHANCGGGCVKMGQGGFARLLRTMPERFREWEQNEEMLRAELGDVAILRDRAGGSSRPLPLSMLRERIEAGNQPDLFDIGGCGCFLDDP